jgi:hypothetical protein
MKPKPILLLLIFNFSFYIVANATVRYVSKTGSAIPPYTSWTTASDSIQKCINICQNGDTVYVANGVYKEQVVMVPGLSLIGGGMDSCVINLEFISTAVKMTDSCILEGFNIIVPDTLNTIGIDVNLIGRGGLVTLCKVNNASQGIYVRNNNTMVYKNIFVKIKSRGINLFNTSSIVRLNHVYEDPKDWAIPSSGLYTGAFDNNYSPTIDSNYIETHREGIRKSFGSRPIIANNTIVMKNASWGIFLSISDSARVYNNLLIFSNAGIGIENNGTPHLQLNNNFLTGKFYDHPNMWAIDIGPNNKVKQNVIVDAKRGIYAGATQNLVVQYNNLWNTDIKYSGFTADSTNLSFDPMIVNNDSTEGQLDFHLQKYSPLIDAGDPTMIDKDSSRIDIGLYGGLYGEVYAYQDKAPRAPRNLSAIVDTNKIILRWKRNTEADTAYYKVYRDTVVNFTIDSTKLISSPKDTFLVQTIPNRVSRYVYKVTCVDYEGNESKPSEEAVVNLTSINDYPMIINDYFLYQNYPNPFNPVTKIGYKLKEGGYVKLYVYDVKGELIEVLVNENQQSGYYEVEFDGSKHIGISSGVYLYQLMVRSENNIPLYSDIKKMIYLR